MSSPIHLTPDDLMFSVITLKRDAFEIRLPVRQKADWASSGPALQTALSTDPGVFFEAKVGENIEKTPYFTPGTEIADAKLGSGSLGAMSRYDGRRGQAHNYIRDGRFNSSNSDYSGIFVSSIDNYYRDVDFLEEGRSLYAVFYMNADNEDDKDILRHSKIELIEINFEKDS